MDEQQRRDIIPELDQLIDRANELKTSYHYLIEHHRLYVDKGVESQQVQAACNALYKVAREMQAASDALKKAGIDYIKGYAATWYGWHVEEEPDAADLPDPDIESVTYQGDDRWEVIMSTVTDGRARMIIQSNAATWDQVYSFDPCLQNEAMP
jgi:hypothetical protein